MRPNRWTFVLKAALADRLVVATAFLVVLLAATLVSAIPIYAKAVAQSGLRARLERAPVTAANLQATVHQFDGGSGRRLDLRVRTLVRDTFGELGVSIFRNRESEPFAAAGRVVVFGSFDGIAQHARLVAGRWPGSGTGGVEVAVPDVLARELQLDVGDIIRTPSRLDGNQIVVRVAGIYRAARPSSVYWWGNPLAIGARGPLVLTRRSFFALGFQDMELRWRIQLDARHLTIDQALNVRRKLARLPGLLNAGQRQGQDF